MPSIIQPDQVKPQAQPTEQSQQHTKPNLENDPSIDDSPTTTQDKNLAHSTDIIDSTEDPIQDIKRDEPKVQQTAKPTHTLLSSDNEELTEGLYNRIPIPLQNYSIFRFFFYYYYYLTLYHRTLQSTKKMKTPTTMITYTIQPQLRNM